jgi:prepilin-type N-terminal cleavage/methylation domain-containing protein
MRSPARGFTLLETMVALILVGISMTALVMAFLNSGKYGVLARRQATAVIVARSQVQQLSQASWTPQGGCSTTTLDSRLQNTNTGNDDVVTGSFADPNGLFASSSIPTGADAPDVTIGPIAAGNESYDVYVNVAPDPGNGVQFAVIVRYKVGSTFARAVALGYRYCSYANGSSFFPL